jgi:hypothetical protein
VSPPPAVSKETTAIPSSRWTTFREMSTFWIRRSGISRLRRETTPDSMSRVLPPRS